MKQTLCSGRRIMVLDCTLRDGGFVNEWKFGHECIINIAGRLDRANMDIIEVGYLRNTAIYNEDSTEFPDTLSINKSIGGHHYNAMIVAIMDYGKCDIERVAPKESSIVDGIRLTFRKNEINEALELAVKIKGLGYKVFLQPVAITDYSASDVVAFVEKANSVQPFAVCMVDTYGFMSKRDLIRYFYLFDASLDDGICLGYHSHNNFQLSYSNSIELIEQISNRELIIDSTVFGMGKGAGNLNTEMITSYINNNIVEKYDVGQVLEIISLYIDEQKKLHSWGYDLRYFLSASTDTHHQYANYLIEKKTLSIDSITTILKRIKDDKRTRYDEEYIESLYAEYQNVEINDTEAMDGIREFIGNRKILLLAPGSSIRNERERIKRYMERENPVVIGINNLFRDFKSDILFISNALRYGQIEDEISQYNMQDIKVIATSNISVVSLIPEWCVNYKNLLVTDELEISDNSALMFLNLLVRLGVGCVSLAGLDGYGSNSNYYKQGIALREDLSKKTDIIKRALHSIKNKIDLQFITKSMYEEGTT